MKMNSATDSRPGFLVSFSKSQVSAFVASVLDYGSVILFVELLHFWYVPATALGAFIGALTNFLLNRHWTFEAGERAWHGQALKYTLVSAGSLALNTAGVWAVTEGIHLHYAASVIAVSLIIGFAYNYPLQRYFVFSEKQNRELDEHIPA